MKKVFVINLIVLLGLLVAVEVGSYIAISAYYHLRNAQQPTTITAGATPAFSSTPDQKLFLTNPEILKDFIAFNKHGYDYADFVMYKLRPFKSRYVNVDQTLTRENGHHELLPRKQNHKVIWVFGSSALFGAWGNADNETVAAYLESILTRKYPSHSVSVRNFGVPNYKIMQEYLRFLYETAVYGMPDAIIIFDGWNDHEAILSGQMDVSGIVHSTLSYYWRFHTDKGIINWPIVRQYILGIFPNAAELVRLSAKYFELRTANSNIEKWKIDTWKRTEATDAAVRRIYESGWQVYEQFAQSFIDKAKNSGIPIILSQQPFISTFQQKTMLPHEQAILDNWRLNTVAMSREKLDRINKINSYHLNSRELVSENLYNQQYHAMNQKIYALSEKNHVGYVDITSLLDMPGNDPVFMTKVHLTSTANQRIAAKFAERLTTLFE